MSTWYIGVILIIFGSVGNNLGSNLISLGHKTAALKSSEDLTKKVNADGTPSAETETHEEKKWRHIGTLIFVFGNLFTFASFGFGAQSLIASLESIQFVSNIVFAKYVHHETITFRMCLATLSIVVGNVLVVLFAAHASILFTSKDMIRLYLKNTIYHVYLVLAFLLWFASNYIYLHYYNSRVVLKKPLLYWHNFLEPFCFSMSSAIIGTQAVLFSKTMSLLIQVTVRGVLNEFARPFIYIILVGWLLLVSYWLRRLDLGFELYPALFIIPVMQVFFVFFAILCGGLYFEEFLHFSVVQFIGFTIGVVMILSGVFGLAPENMELTTYYQQETNEPDGFSPREGVILFEEGQPRVDNNNRLASTPVANSGGMSQSAMEKKTNQNDPIDLEAGFKADIKLKPQANVNNNNNTNVNKVTPQFISDPSDPTMQVDSIANSIDDGRDGGIALVPSEPSPSKKNRKIINRLQNPISSNIAEQ
eukprot:gene5418-7507_t